MPPSSFVNRSPKVIAHDVIKLMYNRIICQETCCQITLLSSSGNSTKSRAKNENFVEIKPPLTKLHVCTVPLPAPGVQGQE
jgi:hypothetical protein